jgi:hypothetical protein
MTKLQTQCSTHEAGRANEPYLVGRTSASAGKIAGAFPCDVATARSALVGVAWVSRIVYEIRRPMDCSIRKMPGAARFLLLVCFSLLALPFATTSAKPDDARETSIADHPSQAQASQKVAVLMERDRRGSPYANSHTHVGATGLVRCGNTVGTAQLVLRHDVIVTAAHVLFGSADGNCVFMPRMGSGEPIPVDSRTIRAGSRTPLSQAATNDWAVARLSQPVPDATPYVLAGASLGPVTLCAAGNGGPTQFGAETCAVRTVLKTAADGIRELAIDCSGSPGGSGGAIIGRNGGIAGIYIGYRSAHPDEAGPFSSTHYNFGITIEGAFRRALLAEAH